MRLRALRAGLAALGMMWNLGSCASTEPNEFTVQNAINDFQYQIRSVSKWTATREYMWRNTGTVASVDQSSFIQAGSATLTLFDANGVQVHSEDLAPTGIFVSEAGGPGVWKIRLTTANVTGTITFRVLGGGN